MTRSFISKFFAVLLAVMATMGLPAVPNFADSGLDTVYVDAARPNDTGDGSSWATAKKYVQSGVTLVNAGGTVNIAAGTYIQSNISVGRAMTIQGAGATRESVIVAPSAEDGNADSAFGSSAQNGFIIAASNVTIKNLTINGRGNPALTLGKNNFRAGIVTLDASQPGGGQWNGLTVDNVYIKYTYRRGISVFPRAVYGTLIQNSRIEYVAYNHGMYLGGQSVVLNNTVKHCFQGIIQDPDATCTNTDLVKANNNVLTEIGNFAGCWGYPNGQPRAIQPNPTGVARAFEVKNNTIDDIGSTGVVGTIGIYTRLANSSSLIENNTITLTSGSSWSTPGGSQAVGMLLGWSYDNGFMARNNRVNSSGYGIGTLVFGTGTAAKPLTLEGNTLSSTAGIAADPLDSIGIYVSNEYLFGPDSNSSYVIIQNSNSVSGYVKGVVVERASSTAPAPVTRVKSQGIEDATEDAPLTAIADVTVIAHNNSIAGNTAGMDASTMIIPVDATNNWWGANTGPFHATTNPSGTGNMVSDMVNYRPWTFHNEPRQVNTTPGTVTVASGAGYLASATSTPAENMPPGLPAMAVMPYGLIGFTVNYLPVGGSVTMTFTLPTIPPPNLQFWKYLNNNWVDCSSLLGSVTDGDRVVTVTITDGGLGDSDGRANGTIVDPGCFVWQDFSRLAASSHGGSMPTTTAPQAPVALPNVAVQSAAVSGNSQVSAQVANTGGASGSARVVLYVDGTAAQSKDVSLAPGNTTTVTFDTSSLAPGSHTIKVNNTPAGSIEVTGGADPAFFIALAAFIILFTGLLIAYLRKQRAM
jgi:hypothetical protein